MRGITVGKLGHLLFIDLNTKITARSGDMEQDSDKTSKKGPACSLNLSTGLMSALRRKFLVL